MVKSLIVINLKETKLTAILYYTYRFPLSKISSLKDYYKHIKKKNIANMKLEYVKEAIVELEWAIENPDFDFNSILPTRYPNHMLLKWFKIKLEDSKLCLKLYQEGIFIVTTNNV